MKKYSFLQRALGLFLCAALLFGYVPLSAKAATLAASAVVSTVTDPGTADTWSDMMGTDIDGNRYAGRVWADKSVYKHGDTVILNNKTGASETVSLAQDEAFQIVFSVLGSTMSSTESITSSGPMDVVLVLDTSTSMDDEDRNGVTRLERTITAANKLLDDLLTLGDIRIAIVTYNKDSETVLPLAAYNNGIKLVVTDYYNNGSSDAGVVSAYDNNNRLLGKDSGYTQGTNLQSGIDRGFNILANATNVSGRAPVAIVLTDGQANRASQEGFYEIASHSDKDGTSASNRNLYLSTLLNAAYTKTKIEANYDRDATVYTIGVDVRGNAVAQLLMNPADSTNGFHNYGTDNSRREITNAYTNFQRWATGATVTHSNWTFNHNYPTMNGAITAAKIAANIYYADTYYDVSNADLANTFEQIYQELSSSAFNPITSSSTNAGGTGVDDTPLIYADYIGQYMEIKEITKVTLFGSSYGVTKKADGTYVVDVGTGVNPTTNERWNTAEDILISILPQNDGTQKLEVRIHQEILPIIMEQVTAKTVGNETTATITELLQEPLRLFYTVGVASDILLPNGQVDISKLQGYQYADAVNGTVSFYSNRFSVPASGEILKGDAHIGFQPSPENRYYYHQKNQGIFTGITDENGDPVTIPANNEYGIVWDDQQYTLNWMTYDEYQTMQPGNTVYTYVSYYRPTPSTTDAANAAEEITYLVYTDWLYLKESVAFYDDNTETYLNDGKVIPMGEVAATIAAYMQANPNARIYAVLGIGSRRTSRLHNMMVDKLNNATETAVERYTPEYLENKSDHHGNDVVIWLGNNGRLTVNIDTGIALTKTVTEAIGSVNDTYALTVTVPAGVAANPVAFDADGHTVNSTYRNNVLTVNVKAGQTVYINGIPAGTQCTIGEIINGDYKISSQTDTVTVPQPSDVLSGAAQYAPAVVTNSPIKYADLVITKSITSDHEIPGSILDTAFDITVNIGATLAGQSFTVEDSASSQPYSVTADASGNLQLQIKARQTVEIFRLPEGTAVTVTEVMNDSHFAVSYRTRNHSGEAEDTNNQLVIPSNGRATAVVVNHYTPDPVTVELDIAGTKNFTAESAHSGGSFTYTVQQWNGTQWVDIPGKTAETPYAAGETGTKYFAIDDVLAGISYTEIGTYAYQVAEVKGNVSNVTYDSTLYTFTVTVTDTGGQLAATVTDLHNTPITDGSYEVTFNNTYHTAPISLDVKKLVPPSKGGADAITLAGFEFQAVQTDANGVALPGTVPYSIHTDAAGEARFFAICTQEDIYHFLITEVDAGKPGWNYSGAQYLVTATVEEDNGNLTASLSIEKRGSTNANETASVDANDASKGTVTFENTYTPATTTVDLDGEVYKSLTGMDLTAGQFTFHIYNDGETADPVLIGTNGLGNDVSLVDFDGVLPFDTVGTYRFDIREVIPAEAVLDTASGKYVLGGMHYDPTVYDLVVEVTNDAATGSLVANHYFEDAVNNAVTFFNSYEVTPTEYALGGIKVLHGRAPRAGEFTFELYEGDDLLQTVTNLADGSFTFEAIPYTEAGEYTYTVRELLGQVPGVVYTGANAPVTVTVAVTDTNGILSAAANVSNADILFENSYAAAPAQIEFNGTKILESGELTDDTFTFHLYQTDHSFDITSESAQLLDTARNLDGSFGFARDLAATGTYYYVIVEDATDPIEGVVYDSTQHTFAVQVNDDGNGQLTAVITNVVTNETTEAAASVSADVSFTNATFDEVVDKQVSVAESDTNIDGLDVNTGDVLTYYIIYRNYTGADVAVEITDTIPNYTAYVEGSASHGGNYAGGHINWLLNVPRGTSVTVYFQVVVEELESGATITNTATVRDGVNTYFTNEVSNPVEIPETPTEPSEPSAPPTEPTAAPTEPTAAPTEPTAAPTEPTVEPTDPTVAPTEPTVEPTEPPTEPEAPADPDIPKTGDSISLQLWFTLLSVSSGGMITTCALGRKKKETEE